MVKFAAQEAYLLYGTILVHVLTLLQNVYPITLDLTFKVKWQAKDHACVSCQEILAVFFYLFCTRAE